MSFVETVPEDSAEGPVAEMYETLRGALGYVPNYGRTFSHRPELFSAWARLNATIKAGMDPRRYELATVAAAVDRRSSYCVLAHGEKLLGLGSEPEQLVALTVEPASAGFSELEEAIVEFARKVAADPVSVIPADVDRLRGLGLSDQEIFDVAAATAARLFFTALQDAMGTRPDAAYREALPGLADVLAVGRPLEDGIEPSASSA